jgi:uncharacterized protein (DUF1697 family)
VTTYIALLRAVNLPAHNKVGTADLRDLLTEAGFVDARSLLQSGNLVFRGDSQTSARVESLLEAAAKKRLGLETDFLVRTAADWKTIVAGNPFPKEAERDPGHLVVMFLKDAPERENVAALQKAIVGRERARRNARTWRPSRRRSPVARWFALEADSSTSSTRTVSAAPV